MLQSDITNFYSFGKRELPKGGGGTPVEFREFHEHLERFHLFRGFQIYIYESFAFSKCIDSSLMCVYDGFYNY